SDGQADKEVLTANLLDEFLFEMNLEVFERAKAFLSQSKLLFYKDGFKWTSVAKRENRLIAILKSIKLNEKNDPYSFLEAKLLSEDHEDVKTAVFILGSMDNVEVLKRLMLSMAKVEEAFIPCYYEGLRHCISDKISRHIMDILPSVHETIQSVCLDILQYRQDYKPANSIKVKTKDKEILGKSALLSFDPKSKSTAFAISNLKPSSEVLLRQLISGNDKTAEIIEGLPLTPELIILYALTEDPDFTHISKAYETNNDEDIKRASILAAGVIGNSESLDFLIEAINDPLKDQSEKSLFMALGESPEESSSITWEEIKKRVLNGNERVRNGSVWNTNTLLFEIKNPLSTAFERKTAWQEIMIEKGTYIPFEQDWFTEKQNKAIGEIESCMR
ncbi:MAG: hypothetical protein GY760_21700, partial [Deltaproteobacteria bacterium]|nr:hypothetical protein [Deltaproteobacteria bacterium]